MSKLRNRYWISILFILIFLSNEQVFAEIKLGISSVRGELRTIKRWEALGKYFSEQIGQSVKIIALTPRKLIETSLSAELKSPTAFI